MSEPNLCANINACEEFRWVYLAPPQGRCRARPAGGAQTEGTGTGKATAAASGGLPRRPPGIARLSASVSAVGSCLGPAELRPWKGCREFQGRAEAKKPFLTLPPRALLVLGPGFIYPQKAEAPRGLALAVPLLCQALVSPPLKMHQLLQRKGGVPMYRWERGGSERKCHLSPVTQTGRAGSGT